MQKFFVKSEQINEKEIIINGTDVKHISSVLRMKNGDNIQVCNIEDSKNYITTITKIDKEKVVVNIIKEISEINESNVQIDLYQGLPKADKMDFIIQKVTEIGVSKIIPVSMIRCVAKIEEKSANKKIERWQKIAKSAAEQSKRDKIPEVENIMTFKELMKKVEDYDSFIVAYEEEVNNTLKNELKNIAKNKEYKIGVLVGPEGGIDRTEIEQLKITKVKIVTLGKRILRCETAPIVITSNIIYELEN